MTGDEGGIDRWLAWADAYLPPGLADAESVRTVRVAVAQAWLGFAATLGMVALYASMGSKLAAFALVAVSMGLAAAPFLVRRGIPVFYVGNAMIGLAYVATFLVALRSGGFGSPALAWNFLLPIAVYAVCGRTSAIVWAALAGLELGGLYVAATTGVRIADDLGPRSHAILAVVGHAGVLAATLALLLVLDRARHASLLAQREAERAIERQRILDDMHDGLGSQLLGLLVEARAGSLDESRLEAGLEGCIDELRLIVDSLDPLQESLEAALAALRARLASRCEALGIELAWDVDSASAALFQPADGLQVLRALMEMVTNALRHAKTPRIDVRLAPRGSDRSGRTRIAISVRDYGVGFASGEVRPGRGMKSLRMRARKLGGELRVEAADPGTTVTLELPR
ncbi:MAG: hypothetical protein U0230_12060 [Polyangiales bacterium]